MLSLDHLNVHRSVRFVVCTHAPYYQEDFPYSYSLCLLRSSSFSYHVMEAWGGPLQKQNTLSIVLGTEKGRTVKNAVREQMDRKAAGRVSHVKSMSLSDTKSVAKMGGPVQVQTVPM